MIFTASHPIIAIVTTALVFLLTIPAFKSIILCTNTRKLEPRQLYEDEDGKATPQSEAAFNLKRKYSKLAITIVTLVAFGLSLALAVLLEIHTNGVKMLIEWMGVALNVN